MLAHADKLAVVFVILFVFLMGMIVGGGLERIKWVSKAALQSGQMYVNGKLYWVVRDDDVKGQNWLASMWRDRP